MLDSPGVENHRGLGATVQSRSLHNLFCRHSSNFRSNLWRITSCESFRFLPTVSACADEILIKQIFLNENMQYAVRESYITPGLQLQMKIALSRGCCLPRIDDDPATAIVALLPEELVQNWKRLST